MSDETVSVVFWIMGEDKPVETRRFNKTELEAFKMTSSVSINKKVYSISRFIFDIDNFMLRATLMPL